MWWWGSGEETSTLRLIKANEEEGKKEDIQFTTIWGLLGVRMKESETSDGVFWACWNGSCTKRWKTLLICQTGIFDSTQTPVQLEENLICIPKTTSSSFHLPTCKCDTKFQMWYFGFLWGVIRNCQNERDNSIVVIKSGRLY